MKQKTSHKGLVLNKVTIARLDMAAVKGGCETISLECNGLHSNIWEACPTFINPLKGHDTDTY